MSKLILALAALTVGLGRTAAAQAPYGSASHTAEVGGVQIDRMSRYRVRKPFEAPKPGAVGRRGGELPSADQGGQSAERCKPGTHGERGAEGVKKR